MVHHLGRECAAQRLYKSTGQAMPLLIGLKICLPYHDPYNVFQNLHPAHKSCHKLVIFIPAQGIIIIEMKPECDREIGPFSISFKFV